MLNDLRTTIVTKRFGSSKISTYTFIFSVFFYYLLVVIVESLWMLGISFLLFSDNIQAYLVCFQYMGVGSLIFSIVITYLLSFSFGIVILTITKRNFVISVIALLVFIISLVLAGFAAPPALIHCLLQESITEYNTGTNLYYFVYFDPFWYTSALIYNSFYTYASAAYNFIGCSIFNLTTPILCQLNATGTVEWFLTTTEKWLNLLIPFSCIEIFGIIGVIKFKWSVR